MRRMLPLAAVFVFGIVLGAGSFALLTPRREGPFVETTFKRNDPIHARFIANRVKALEWPAADGRVMRFAAQGGPSPHGNLTLAGTDPVSLTDDHGQNTLALVEVRENKAKIAYVSRFDHLSFGRNLVTVDCGIVELDVVEADD